MNYLSMTKSEITNGNGIRVALWVSGCNHHCKNCQNPESWDCNAGKKFTDKDFNNLVKELSLPYYDGITLTGGDPLHPNNINDVEDIVIKIKELLPNKTVWCYTGYKYENIKELNIMNYIDVLVDDVYIDKLRDITLPFKGSKNQRVINVKESFKQNKTVLIDD